MAVALPTSVPIAWITAGGRALALTGFRGRILILDFWTFGCINCIHMILELHEFEPHFPEEMDVVGIHLGKCINECVTRIIARACERLGVEHPVVNDRQFRIWHE